MRAEAYLSQLRSLLPGGWSVALTAIDRSSRGPDGTVRLTGPDGTQASLLLEMKTRLGARQASEIARRLADQSRSDAGDGLIVFAPYVSSMTRQRLREAGIAYVDLTGNVWVSLARPAVFLDRVGLTGDPSPLPSGVRSLKGAKAARIVRALLDFRPPSGVRELASRTGVDPGYVTRVLAMLADEDLVRRGRRGEVLEVQWADLLGRWAIDYAVTRSNRAVPCLAPRGVADVRERLARWPVRYAITGMFAVPREAQIASGGLLLCYVDAPEAAGEQLEIVPAESGANVILLEPYDEVVFIRTRIVLGTAAVALPQCAVDLLTGSGREPAQGDALITWMAENEHAWRT
jgi:hypothetical protein